MFMKVNNLDSMYIYKNYFPKNNYDVVLENLDNK